MVVFQEQGQFSKPLLRVLLSKAGVVSFGITGDDTAVQIICQDGTQQGAIDAVIAAYPKPVTPSDPPTKNLVAAVKAVVTAADFPTAQANLKALIASMIS